MAAFSCQVLVVDDDGFNREGLRLYLEQQGFEVLEAGDERTAWEIALEHKPDAAILDIVIPPDPQQRFQIEKSVGMRLARRLKQHDPSLGVVLFSAHPDRGSEIWEMLRAGVRGIAYQLKGNRPATLLNALESVLAGRVVIDPEVSFSPSPVRDLFAQLTPEERPWVERVAMNLEYLTPREREVANRLAASHTTEGIARSLCIAVKTVENHISRLYGKLGLNDMVTQAPQLRRVVILAKAYMIHDLRSREGG